MSYQQILNPMPITTAGGTVVLSAGSAAIGSITNTSFGSNVNDGSGTAINSLTAGTGQNGLMMAIGATNYALGVGNTSVVQLAAAATFTGTIENTLNEPAASILIVCDQPGILTLNEYITSSASSICGSTTVNVPATTGGNCFARSFTVNGNYFNLTFKNNGGSTTTTLNINTYYGTILPATQLNNGPVGLMEVNGAAISLGQTTMTASLPVTIANNQSALSATTTPAASTYQGVSAVSGSASAKTAPIFTAIADGTNTSVLGAMGTAPATSIFGVPTNSSIYVGATPTAVTAATFGTTAAGTGVLTNSSVFVGTTLAVAASAGVLKVGISGATGATLDAVTTAATTPANGAAVLVSNVTTAPSLATGQSVALQADYQGSTFVKPYRRGQTVSATGTFTAATATTFLAAQAAGVFADLASLVITQGLGATANVYFTVNVSDGTKSYNFNMFSNDSVSVTPTGSQALCMTFNPPIPATSAATAWTIALSSVTDTPTINATGVFVLQKAS